MTLQKSCIDKKAIILNLSFTFTSKYNMCQYVVSYKTYINTIITKLYNVDFFKNKHIHQVKQDDWG